VRECGSAVPGALRTSALRTSALIVFSVLFSAAVLSAQMSRAPKQYLDAKPIAESEAVPAGSTARLILNVEIEPGLHAQANHPLDENLIPMKLTLDTPAGVTVVDVTYPPSKDFLIAGDRSLVFEGTVLIGVRLNVAADRAPGPLTIPAKLQYQACNDRMCFNPSVFGTAWSLRIVPAREPITPQHKDLFDRVDFTRAEPPDKASGWRPAAGQAAPGTSEPQPSTIAQAAPSNVEGQNPRTSEPTPQDILAMFDKFDFIALKAYAEAPEFLQFIKNAEAGVKEKGMFEGQGPLAILAIVFLGGLALNLTPCVLPMIPINLAIIGAGTQSKNRGRGFALGAAYGAAMALVYGVLGLVVVMVGGTFGAINSTVWFNVGIAILFVVLALAMFDVISIDFSKWSSKFQFESSSRGTFLLAFGMGSLAALLAGACVAPVVIQVVLFSSNMYAAGTTIALALPFVLGLGMAVPWPLAGAGMASLPKPGAWMIRVKQALGVFILATAAYYGYVAYQIIDSRRAVAQSASAGEFKDGWYTSVVPGLQAALRDNKPAMVDFWATWCKDCIVMDKTTLKNAQVLEALKGYTLVKYQTEEIGLPHIEELLTRYGTVGLPAYVILKPKSN
jgi:thiol:disulfide interchange protein DsbD